LALLEMSKRIAPLLDNLSEEIGGEQLYETADAAGALIAR
jgi:hypothetical protein